MSVVVIGLNHRTVPLDLLERMTIDESRLGKALHEVASREHVSEAVVLSTCNRTEIYVVAEKFHGAYTDVRDFLSEMAFLAPEDFSDHLYVSYDEEAAAHLFAVTSGLESAVIGEAEILGQVRNAWTRAQEEGTVGTTLNLVFRHALEVGKRARTETGISRHIASVSTAAVAMAAERLGSLQGRSILVLGAGDMGEGMVRSLVAAGVDDVRIANRTWERAVELAERVGGRALALTDVESALLEVDLLLTSTGASSLMLEHGDLARVMGQRTDRPLLVVDVAVPRDVDPAAGQLDGITLLDMDDLRDFAEAGVDERRREVAAVRTMVDDEVARYAAVTTAQEVAPLIGALHDRAEAVRTAELDRFRGRLAELDPRQLEAVEALTHGIVAKLLHDPTVGLKDAAGTARGERLAEALRDLFKLESERVTTTVVRVATRGSALARWQAARVSELLRAEDPALEVELVVVETSGDRRLDVPIWELGGKGVFVKEVQAAVLEGRADLAVHSAKDLPVVTHDDLVFACVPPRADPRDALIGSTLAGLAPGAQVATGSVRRRAQLAGLRPDLTFAGLRGNIDTRLGKAGEFGAIVMAAAALERLDRSDEIAELLEPSVMLPQVGQGALAVECRRADPALTGRLAVLEHRPSRVAVDAERGFLAELGGDCDLPAGAHATLSGDQVQVEGLIASADGHVVLRHHLVGPVDPDPAELGRQVAGYLLVDAGGASLLER